MLSVIYEFLRIMFSFFQNPFLIKKCYIFFIFSILVNQRPKNTFKNYGERIQK